MGPTHQQPIPSEAHHSTIKPHTMRRSAILPILVLFLTTALTDAIQFRAAPHRPDFPTTHRILPSHGVDDVGTALTNATTTAYHRAKDLLTKYSATIRIFAIPTGLAVTFFGYFLLTPVLFLAAFVSGGGACFIAVNTILGEETPAAVWISIAAMLLGGALLGFLALRALNFGMFAVGAALGVVLASSLKTTLIAQAYPKDPRMAFIIAAVTCGLVFGLLAMCLQKQMLIFSTAYAGSSACMFGIGSFAGHFPTTEDLSKVEAGRVDGWVLLYLGLTFLLGTTGMFFQFWLGRGKPMPEHAPHDRRRRRRRLRQYQFDDLSDDDDWADDVYIERVPLPRRKREPSRVRESTSAERSVVYERPRNEERVITRTTVSHNSWDSVKSAPVAFDMHSSTDDTHPSSKVDDVDVNVPNVEDDVSLTTLKITDGRSPEDTLVVPRSEITKSPAELLDLSDSPEPADMRRLDETHEGLEHVPLESDGENLGKV